MPQKDAIDEFIGLPEDRQLSQLKALSRDEQDRLLQKVKERRAKQSRGVTGDFALPSFTEDPIGYLRQTQHPYLATSLETLGRFGRGATDAAANIAGTPSTIYHAFADPLTPAEQADPTYSMFGSTLTNPLRRLVLEQQFDQLNKASSALRAGQPAAAAFHLGSSMVPGVGPLVGQVGERAAGGDIPGAAGEALTYYLAPEVAGEAKGLVREPIARLRESARSIAQSMTGASAFRTTQPEFQKFTERAGRAAEKQAAVTAADEAFNRRQAEKTVARNQELQARHEGKVAASERQAAEANAAARATTSQQLEQARGIRESNARAEALDRGLKEGSQRLGEQVKDLDARVRVEANEKYDAVKTAVAGDPGVPLADLADAARYAEQNILKGSAENIKQFRELTRNQPEEIGLTSINGYIPEPGTAAAKLLEEQGVLNAGGNIPFDQLQGYSSEIGERIARGGLQGDVYQALKYLKDKIDTAKTTIADRNGVGAALRNADSFWRSYMDLFYDSDSALAKVRESVGTLDPEFYADPFTKGKAAEVAIGKLKSMRSRYTTELSGVADLSRNLRSATEERSNIRVAKVPTVEKPALTQPKPVEPSRTETPTTRVPRTVPQPTPPTMADIVERKRQAVVRKGEEFKQLRTRDAFILATSIVGGLLGENVVRGLVGGVVAEGVVKGVGHLLTRPKVVEWIARPTATDLALVDKLPEAAQVKLRTELQSVINQEQSAGRPISVAPSVARFLARVGVATATAVQNRKEAMELLGQNPAQPSVPVQSPPVTAAAAVTTPTSSTSTLTAADRRPVSRDDPQERQREDRRARLKNPIDVMDSSTGIIGQISASAWDPDRYVMRNSEEKPPARSEKPGADDFVPDPSELQPFVGQTQ